MFMPVIMCVIGVILLIVAIIFMTGYNPIPFMSKVKEKNVEEFTEMIHGKEYDVTGLNKFMGRIIFLSIALLMFVSAGIYAFILPEIEWSWFEWAYVGAFFVIVGGLCVYAYGQIKSERFIKETKKEEE